MFMFPVLDRSLGWLLPYLGEKENRRWHVVLSVNGPKLSRSGCGGEKVGTHPSAEGRRSTQTFDDSTKSAPQSGA